MKYIISESRLSEFMNDYLDSFLEEKIVSRVDHYIVVSDNVESDKVFVIPNTQIKNIFGT